MNTLSSLFIISLLSVYAFTAKEIQYNDNDQYNVYYNIKPPLSMSVQSLKEHKEHHTDPISQSPNSLGFMPTDSLLAYQVMEENTIEYLELVIDILMSPKAESTLDSDGSTVYDLSKTLADARYFTTATTQWASKTSVDNKGLQMKGGHTNIESSVINLTTLHKAQNVYGKTDAQANAEDHYCRNRQNPDSTSTTKSDCETNGGKWTLKKVSNKDLVYVYNWKKSQDYVYLEVGTNLNTIMKPIGNYHGTDFQDDSIDDATADNVYYKRQATPRTDFSESPGENVKCLCQCGNNSSVPNEFDNNDRQYWFGFWSPENKSAKGQGTSKVFQVTALATSSEFVGYPNFTAPNNSDFNNQGFCNGGIVLECRYVQPEAVGTNPLLPEDGTGDCENTTEWCRKSHVDNRYLDRKVSCEIGNHANAPNHARFASNYNGFVYIERQFFDQFIDKLSSANSGQSVTDTEKWKFYTEAYNILRDNLYVLKPGCPDPEIPFYPPIDPCLISQTCDPTEAEKCDRITQWIEKQTYEHYITTNFEYCAKIVLKTCPPKQKTPSI